MQCNKPNLQIRRGFKHCTSEVTGRERELEVHTELDGCTKNHSLCRKGSEVSGKGRGKGACWGGLSIRLAEMACSMGMKYGPIKEETTEFLY